jgi:hypothetical protein
VEVRQVNEGPAPEARTRRRHRVPEATPLPGQQHQVDGTASGTCGSSARSLLGLLKPGRAVVTGGR